MKNLDVILLVLGLVFIFVPLAVYFFLVNWLAGCVVFGIELLMASATCPHKSK